MTTSAEIKVGTRVRIGASNGGYKHEPANGLVPGNTGTVKAATSFGSSSPRGAVYDVRTDNAEHPTDGWSLGWAFYADELEVIE